MKGKKYDRICVSDVNRLSRGRQNKYGIYVKERVLEVACFLMQSRCHTSLEIIFDKLV
jgi:hypothetical protein